MENKNRKKYFKKFLILASLLFSYSAFGYSLSGDCRIMRDQFPNFVEKFDLKLIRPESHFGLIATGSSSFGDSVDIQMINHTGSWDAHITMNGVNNSAHAFSILPFDANGVVRFMMGTALYPTQNTQRKRNEIQQLSCELTISK